jgi:hypothetical protein
MWTYLKNSYNEWVCYKIGWTPMIFDTEEEAKLWCLNN